jgi:hypothetical protein
MIFERNSYSFKAARQLFPDVTLSLPKERETVRRVRAFY